MNIDYLVQKLQRLPANEQDAFFSDLDALRGLRERSRCQEDFLAFVHAMWPGFVNGRHHKVMARKFEEIAAGKLKRLIINMPPRHALMTSMRIPTPSGFKTIADLKVGDFVFGSDGKPTPVLGKSEVFHGRQLYKVTTDDGASLVVDGEHLWTVRLDRKRPKYLTYTTEQLFQRQQGVVFQTLRNGEVEIVPHKKVKDVRLPRLPEMPVVQYEAKDLPIDPYVLGVWLGDGASAHGVITAKDDDAIVLRAEFERREVQTTDQATRYTFGTIGLKAKLQALNLLKNKHIPQIYLEASPEQRRELLKGLMDTDGNVSQKGQCFFAQSNKAFIESVAQLIRSLGIKVSILTSEAKIEARSYGETWRLSFYANDICKLPRKEERTLKTTKRFGRYISVKRYDVSAPTQCIKVDREDGLFLAGEGYICTHNTKSEFGSYLLPAWFLGKFPDKKIIQSSNTAELATGFGRKVRNLVDSEAYARIFPNVNLRHDSKAAGRWAVNQTGEYFAIGVGGTVTGKGADLLIIDDPHSEQEAKLASTSPEIFDSVYEWYTSGPRQRLQPGGAIVIIQTRWSKKDLTGRIIQSAIDREGNDDWEVIDFPAILPSEKPLWPEFWSLEELEALRSELPASKWNAQYQQNPTAEEGAIVKREWWKMWEGDHPPPCDFIIQSWDTAFLKSERSDYSACTTWGVFYKNENQNDANIILLDAFKRRMEFPELKEEAFRQYKNWEPDAFVVEAKASGAPLIFELRAMGIPVQEFTPSRGNDKIVRINSVADLFSSGKVWAPSTRWADELIEEMAAFPNSDHDDLVDSTTQALIRFRKGGFIRLPSDEADEPREFRPRRAYY